MTPPAPSGSETARVVFGEPDRATDVVPWTMCRADGTGRRGIVSLALWAVNADAVAACLIRAYDGGIGGPTVASAFWDRRMDFWGRSVVDTRPVEIRTHVCRRGRLWRKRARRVGGNPPL